MSELKLHDSNKAGIFHLHSAQNPEVRFEWHENSKKLFVLYEITTPPTAEELWSNIQSAPAAQFCVAMWLKGWRSGQSQLGRQLHLGKILKG